MTIREPLSFLPQKQVLTCRFFGAFVAFLCLIPVDSCLLPTDYKTVPQVGGRIVKIHNMIIHLLRYDGNSRKDQSMKNQRILKWPIVILMLVITSNLSSLHAVTVSGLIEKAIYDGIKYLTNIGNEEFDAVGKAEAAGMVIDTSESHQKVWYSEELMEDHQTIKNGWRSDPISTNKGEATTDHRYYPANFEYYDLKVYFKDPNNPGQWLYHRNMVGERCYEPDFYLQHHMSYVIWATTKKSHTKFRVLSRYSMEDGPDDRLREPGKYRVEIKFKVYRLNYTEKEGMVRIPDDEPLTVSKKLSSIADDNAQLTLLGSQQWMMEGPNAYGSIVRSWEKHREATVHSSMVQPVPVGVPTGGAPVTIREVYRIKETTGN